MLSHYRTLSRVLSHYHTLPRVHLESLNCAGYRVVHITSSGTAARWAFDDGDDGDDSGDYRDGDDEW